MKEKFLNEIEGEIGQMKYSGIISSYWKEHGTKHCWFSEENDSLAIHVDPETGKEGAIELKKIIPITLQYYNILKIIFDDWMYLVEFLSLSYPQIYDIKNYKTSDKIIEKHYKNMKFKCQNIDNAYGMITIERIY